MRQKTISNTIEKVTRLDADGDGMRKFRKADELYYLMKRIKRAKTGSTEIATYEDDILRIDL